jgi:hypothetical protein
MKLSHAASTTLTAIAELTALIGVGSGGLLGIGFLVWSNISVFQVCSHRVINALDCRVALLQCVRVHLSTAPNNLNHLRCVNHESVEHMRRENGIRGVPLYLLAKLRVMISGNLCGDLLDVPALLRSLDDNNAGNRGGTAEKTSNNGSDDGSGSGVEWHDVIGVCVGYAVGSLVGPVFLVWWINKRHSMPNDPKLSHADGRVASQSR